jgi:hypothetical protein
MWVALFVNLACTNRQPVEIGEFTDYVACLRWVALEEFRHPRIKGRCEPRALNTKSQCSG